MARTKVVIYEPGVIELLNSGEVRADLASRADRVVSAAQASAAVDSGTYRDSIHRVSATTDRAIELVVASDWKSHILEARTGNLARALTAAGGD